VPLQSGDAGVLGAMRRTYTVAAFLGTCARARAALPGLNLTTDAIVGFPGEDEAAFARTADVVRETGMSKVHVFPYSPRPGTPAAARDDHLPAEVVRERGARLRDLSDRAGAEHRAARVGSRDVVLVEKAAPDGTLTGLGADYTRFALPPGTGASGEMVPVVAEAVVGEHLAGRPVEIAA
jgi:tRNA A37 methylthiotransferase MiaB